MIKTFGSRLTTRFIETGKSKFSGMDVDLARTRLRLLNSVTSLDELAKSRRYRLHGLGGDFKGFWAIDINGPWRLIFEWREPDAYEVQIIDYH
jgi:proteic killer suppression protein